MKSLIALRRNVFALGLVVVNSLNAGCRASAPMPTVPQVDLQRYMGDWYVIAAIPSFPERNAYNAIESYARLPDGRIRTIFRYRNGSLTAPVKTLHAVGTVQPGTGQAVWGMQFIWPIKAEYLIAYLDPEYHTVIVGRSKRDYVWIMARTPTLPESAYARLAAMVAALGYDTTKLRKVPQ